MMNCKVSVFVRDVYFQYIDILLPQIPSGPVPPAPVFPIRSLIMSRSWRFEVYGTRFKLFRHLDSQVCDSILFHSRLDSLRGRLIVPSHFSAHILEGCN